MSKIIVKDNEVAEFINANPDATLETLTLRFPDADVWTLRAIRREVRREQAFGEASEHAQVDAPISGLTKQAMTVLRSGFVRPMQIILKDRKRTKPIFKKVNWQMLVISDIHAPDHDEHALDASIQVGQALGVDEVTIAGDGFDCHAVSKYTPAAQRPFRWVDERALAVPVFAEIREEFPNTPINWLDGNHDVRPHSFIAANAPQLQGLFTLPELLGISDLGFRFPEGNRIIVADRLLIKHGVTVSGDSGASVAKEVRKHGMSVVMGHVHRLAYVPATKTAQQILGEQPLVGVELGCLANLRPDYLPPEETANWQHGCAIVNVYDNGLINVQPVPIFNGTAFYGPYSFTSRKLPK